jgi:hypothetical protein
MYGHDEHLEPMVKHFDHLNYDTRYNIVNNPTLSSDHINKILDSNHSSARIDVLDQPNINKKHLSKVIGSHDETSEAKETALRHPLIDHTHIDLALNDHRTAIHMLAVNHDSANKDNLEKASKLSDFSVKEGAKNRLKQLEFKDKKVGGFDKDVDPNMHKLFEGK